MRYAPIQDDDVERSQHVAITGDIVLRAWNVIVWLRPDVFGKARSAFGVIHCKSAFLISRDLSSGEESLDDTSLLHTEFYRSAEWTKVKAAVKEVFGRAWFRRLWYTIPYRLARAAY